VVVGLDKKGKLQLLACRLLQMIILSGLVNLDLVVCVKGNLYFYEK